MLTQLPSSLFTAMRLIQSSVNHAISLLCRSYSRDIFAQDGKEYREDNHVVIICLQYQFYLISRRDGERLDEEFEERTERGVTSLVMVGSGH